MKNMRNKKEKKKSNGSVKNKKLAKTLKRAKRYAQTRFLEGLGYIKSQGYPKKMYITSKGLEALQGARIQ
jgi:hypothetical protein